MLLTTTRRTRRTPSSAGQAQLARRLQKSTARNTPLDPPAGKIADPRTPLRRAARGLWRRYHQVLGRKDRAVVLLRDAITTEIIMITIINRIAELDQELCDLDMALAHLEDQLRPLSPSLSAPEVAHAKP